MDKWPDVPALFGWLRLDRRGYWYLKGRRIEREPTLEFIARNYHDDEHGRWFFQNGPQRGFVDLDYTPWVYRSQPDGGLLTHTGHAVMRIDSAWLDEDGSLLLESEHGVGLLDDHDLDWALERLRDEQGAPAADQEQRLAAALESPSDPPLSLWWDGAAVTIRRIGSAQVPERFGFVLQPSPVNGEKGERPTPTP
jgi:hypothetical protein